MLAESFDDVTILFADIVGFTKYSAGKEPRQVIEMLSKLFTEFDKECNRLNLYKVYTIGDCYVVLGFIDKRNRKPPSEEASDVIQMGISMIQSINKVRKQVNFMELNMRIGIHTVGAGSPKGKLFGGIVGTDIVRFDIYGPDVLIANKMESGGMPGKICISKKTKDLIETLETTSYTFSENKPIHIKSLGIAYESYFVGSKLLRDEEAKDDSLILDDRDNLTQVN